MVGEVAVAVLPQLMAVCRWAAAETEVCQPKEAYILAAEAEVEGTVAGILEAVVEEEAWGGLRHPAPRTGSLLLESTWARDTWDC